MLFWLSGGREISISGESLQHGLLWLWGPAGAGEALRVTVGLDVQEAMVRAQKKREERERWCSEAF